MTDRPKSLTRAERFSAPELKSRGWTEAGIRRFLGEPDAWAPNPFYRSAAPMRFYERVRVERVEGTAEWQVWLEARRRRGEAASRAAETQRQQLLREIERLPPPPLPVLSKDDLRRHAYEHWRSWKLLRGDDVGGDVSTETEDEFLDRLSINYLRHECSDYEERCNTLWGRVGREDGYDAIRHRIDYAIIDHYPHLLDAVTRAQRRRYDLGDRSR